MSTKKIKPKGDKDDNIKVAVRVRPFLKHEHGEGNIVDMSGKVTTLKDLAKGDAKSFTFDYSYNSCNAKKGDENYADNRTIFADLGQTILDNAFQGFNCSLFAYGQTGAGKSYSMMGYGMDRGIIPMVCEEIFARCSGTEEDSDGDGDSSIQTQYIVENSMLEIYNEKIRDLLKPNSRANLRIRQHPKEGPYVENLTKAEVGAYEETRRLMDLGAQSRTIASTNMNSTSSRAHTIFTITFTQRRINSGKGAAAKRVSKINLIDLAGSERQAKTGATGDRFKEAIAINKSLSALGNVINALVKTSHVKGKTKRIPYRDSVLTQLLQQSLGGNARTIMIAAISPAANNYNETLSTLRYADRAKQIKTKAVVNENPMTKLVNDLKAQIAALQSQVQQDGQRPQTAIIQEELKAQLKAEWEREKALHKKELLEQIARSSEVLAAQGIVMMTAETTERMGKEPYLSNLHEDIGMNGKIVHFLSNAETTFGRSSESPSPDVVLEGLSMKKLHCTIYNRGNEGLFIKSTSEGAKVLINGANIPSTGQELTHGNRVVLGNNHLFVLIVPPSEVPSDVDFDMAMKEVNQLELSLFAAAADEARAQVAKEMQEMMVKMEKMQSELKIAKEQDTRDLKLERQLERQIVETEQMTVKKELENLQRQELDKQLLKIIPLLNEANSLSEELLQNVLFKVKLMAATKEESSQARSSENTETTINILLHYLDDSSPDLIWSLNKFKNRLYLMREMYECLTSDGRNMVEKTWCPIEKNPFVDPPAPILIGSALIYLDSLTYMLSIEETTPVIDYSGTKQCDIDVAVEIKNIDGVSSNDWGDEMRKHMGCCSTCHISIKRIKNIPRKLANNCFVKFFLAISNEKSFETARIKNSQVSPNLIVNWETDFSLLLSEKNLAFLEEEAIEFLVYGHPAPQPKQVADVKPIAQSPQIVDQILKVNDNSRDKDDRDAIQALKNMLDVKDRELLEKDRKIKELEMRIGTLAQAETAKSVACIIS